VEVAKVKITFINPNIVTQKGDFFGTGIPYMPIVLAYAASFLREKGFDISVVDAFGERPTQKRVCGDNIIQGLFPMEVAGRVSGNTDLICICAGHLIEHDDILKIVKVLKKKRKTKICIIENSQAVTSYPLLKATDDYFNAGADFLIYGEPEFTLLELLQKKMKDLSSIDGLIYLDKGKQKINKRRMPAGSLDVFPFPAWDLFPIRNYWKLGYAHAPYRGSYLPLLTSRGCPFRCGFCTIPFMTEQRWRARSADNVLDEIKYFNKDHGVKYFHIEDLNPTIDKKRMLDLAKGIIDSRLDVRLKFASGTKIETFDEEVLTLLAKAGCDYVSFSPESGSKRVLSLMKKPFDHGHGLKMLKVMKSLGITTQACFILGYPGEKKEDIVQTRDYVYELFRAGLDEMAILVMAPVPGSAPYEFFQQKDLTSLTFSPKWRKDYDYLNKTRFKIYIRSYLIKMFRHPVNFFSAMAFGLFGRFRTKSEMTLYRLLKVYSLPNKGKSMRC